MVQQRTKLNACTSCSRMVFLPSCSSCLQTKSLNPGKALMCKVRCVDKVAHLVELKSHIITFHSHVTCWPLHQPLKMDFVCKIIQT